MSLWNLRKALEKPSRWGLWIEFIWLLYLSSIGFSNWFVPWALKKDNFEYLNSDSRLKTPLKKIENELVEIEIQDVYSELSEVIKDRQTKVNFLLGSNLTNEDYVAFREFSEIISQSEKDLRINLFIAKFYC